MNRTLGRVLAVPVVVAVLVGGFYVISRSVPTGGLLAIGAGVGWVAVAAAGFAWLARGDRLALGLVLAAVLLVGIVGGVLIAPRASEVDEDVVTAAPPTEAPEQSGSAAKPAASRRNVQVASGRFEGVSGHRGVGRAAVIELAEGGRRLTFRDFDVEPGAAPLRVYLAADDPGSDGAVKDFIDLAPLKGTKGNQQYRIPGRVNLRRYTSVIVWCVPFTTRIAQARLRS